VDAELDAVGFEYRRVVRRGEQRTDGATERTGVANSNPDSSRMPNLGAVNTRPVRHHSYWNRR